MIRSTIGIALFSTLIGCAGSGGGKVIGTACPEERPQVCTLQYAPVCAVMDDGSRREFANGCNSCADPQVVSYEDGGCEEL